MSGIIERIASRSEDDQRNDRYMFRLGYEAGFQDGAGHVCPDHGIAYSGGESFPLSPRTPDMASADALEATLRWVALRAQVIGCLRDPATAEALTVLRELRDEEITP
jgi:hypothetical protein